MIDLKGGHYTIQISTGPDGNPQLHVNDVEKCILRICSIEELHLTADVDKLRQVFKKVRA